MIGLIEDNRSTIEGLCKKYGVVRLDVFGSAAAGGFDFQTSDLDFLVEFEPRQPGPLADAYFGLLSELERVFQRSIDLVTPGAIRNPYFRRGIDETRRMLYAA
ncbi:MAG: nucleotidyltransferase family protein [Phycisphaerae bacterium]